VADGLFDVGITGRDWVEERGSEVTSLGVLHYSKATSNPVRVVLAVSQASPVQSVADLAASGTGAGGALRVSTEYPELTRRYLEKHGVRAEIRLSHGATEAKIPDIADAVVEITETGRALRAAGLRVLDTVLVSYTELIANPTAYADEEKRHAMEQILTLLQGTLVARGRVLVKLNVAAGDLTRVMELLPALKSPTVSQLYGDGGFAVEAVVPKHTINVLIPALKDHGATDILEIPISKIVP
jgi:ATP phosphoribosyltransferase